MPVCVQYLVKLEVSGSAPVETNMELHRDVDWEPGGALILVCKLAFISGPEQKVLVPPDGQKAFCSLCDVVVKSPNLSRSAAGWVQLLVLQSKHKFDVRYR